MTDDELSEKLFELACCNKCKYFINDLFSECVYLKCKVNKNDACEAFESRTDQIQKELDNFIAKIIEYEGVTIHKVVFN